MSAPMLIGNIVARVACTAWVFCSTIVKKHGASTQRGATSPSLHPSSVTVPPLLASALV